ncbi:DUF6083 domain-containing protein [Streptomyces sp. NBC_01381]|uniref:zinc finger domain-containing protein n=1 Tax=Streptomyces sp. NBC_01381 TaxID=2903845 RepID=UPI0022528EFA|nr:DUF6083 domain-containing protein [Streptomyces sp. NBC_01381]MCX4673595.1 DUF6083 domain-containing protein [Streptomyces sp. NBC_01381]
MKNAELGDLAQCDVCRMGVRRHSDSEGSTVDLDLREAPVGLVPAGLRWYVAGDGTAINLGQAGPETVRVRHHDACHSGRADLTTLRTLWPVPFVAVGPLPPGVNSENEIHEALRRPTTREQARSIPCPVCEVDAGLPCTGPDGERRSANHRERANAYRSARWQTWLPGTPTPTRNQVRTVACPVCAAPAHAPCRQPGGAPRQANHFERLEALLSPEELGSASLATDAAVPPQAAGEVPAQETQERPRGRCGGCGAVILLIGRALEDGLCKLCREEAAELAVEAKR